MIDRIETYEWTMRDQKRSQRPQPEKSDFWSLIALAVAGAATIILGLCF